MTGHDLDVVYKQTLEASIIEYLAKIKQISQRQAMDVYYKSKLSEQIENGTCGIENLDYKNLTEDLVENEPELFK